MASKQKWSASAAALGMLILILDGKTALQGSREGIDLCIRTVIPSLFPFFVLSPILAGSMDALWLRPAAKLYGIPEGAEPLMLVGFLGGFPTGAQCVAQAYSSGKLTKQQAERMLPFCNNAGPSFLFGMVSQMFKEGYIVWLLWAVQIISALLVAWTLPGSEHRSTEVSITPMDFTQALSRGIKTMGQVCGWVVLFRVGICFADRWVLWLLPEIWQVVICGLLELSNGCCALGQIGSSSLRFLVCSGLLASGGLCVTMQTASVTKGLSLKRYISGKLLQVLYSLLLAFLIQFTFPDAIAISASILLPVLTGVPVIWLYLRKKKNSSGIPAFVGV